MYFDTVLDHRTPDDVAAKVRAVQSESRKGEDRMTTVDDDTRTAPHERAIQAPLTKTPNKGGRQINGI